MVFVADYFWHSRKRQRLNAKHVYSCYYSYCFCSLRILIFTRNVLTFVYFSFNFLKAIYLKLYFIIGLIKSTMQFGSFLSCQPLFYLLIQALHQRRAGEKINKNDLSEEGDKCDQL